MKGDFRMRKTRRTTLLVGLAALAIGLLPVLAGAGACNSKSTFYVPKADTGATQQIVSQERRFASEYDRQGPRRVVHERHS
jgi:hypothetical protein